MNLDFKKKLETLKQKSSSSTNSNGALTIANILALVGPSTEWDLICFMKQNKIWINTGINPALPTNYNSNLPIEFGLFLYWIYNPPLLVKDKFKNQIAEIVYELNKTYAIKSSQMTGGNYNILGVTKSSLIYHDGSVLCTEKYAAYDIEKFVFFLTLYQNVPNVFTT